MQSLNIVITVLIGELVVQDQTKKLTLALELVKLSSILDLAEDAHSKILIFKFS